MPNWATGPFKISGKFEDVISFFRNGVKSSEIIEKEDTVKVLFKDNRYIVDTRRCFLALDEVEIPKIDRDEEVYVELEIECAWDIDDDGLKDISGKYNLDISVDVDEPGYMFTHTFVCYNGVVTDNTVKDYVLDGDGNEIQSMQ